MTVDTQPPATWWGNFNFEQTQNKRWCNDPLNPIVHGLKNVWQIAHEKPWDTNGAQGTEIAFPHRCIYAGSVTTHFPIETINKKQSTWIVTR